jgi:DNA-binding Xre family transcriptional regulator
MKNKLKDVREATIDPGTGKKMTAAALGKKIGKSETQVRRLESGFRDFTLFTLGSCCEALGCDWDDIIDIPLSKRRKRLDVELMEISISCLFAACAHYKINVDKSGDQFPVWVSKVYEGAVTMNLDNPTQIRDLAMLVIKPFPKSRKA